MRKEIKKGNPRYVAGMNGCELARLVLEETHLPFEDNEDVMYLDKSPEYWSGWALAFYQWYSGRRFMDILDVVPVSKLISLYPVYHEMDIMQFVDYMNQKLSEAQLMTKLKTMRINCALSQSQLAAMSGVAIRQIQLFEQRQRNINNAAAITLLKLSRALNCSMEDLIEY